MSNSIASVAHCKIQCWSQIVIWEGLAQLDSDGKHRRVFENSTGREREKKENSAKC